MRKRFLATLLCLLSLCTYGYAQKGLQSVGMNVSYNDDFSHNKGLGLGVKYHYYLSNYIRVSPTIKWVSMKEVFEDETYQGENDYTGMPYYNSLYGKLKTTGLDVSIDFHWFFIPPHNRLRPYLITGVSSGFLKAKATMDSYSWGYINSKGDYEVIESNDSESCKSKFALNYGIGLNWEVTPTISLQFEVTRREEFGGNRYIHEYLYYSYYSYYLYDHSNSTYDSTKASPFTYIQIAIGAAYNF